MTKPPAREGAMASRLIRLVPCCIAVTSAIPLQKRQRGFFMRGIGTWLERLFTHDFFPGVNPWVYWVKRPIFTLLSSSTNATTLSITRFLSLARVFSSLVNVLKHVTFFVLKTFASNSVSLLPLAPVFVNFIVATLV